MTPVNIEDLGPEEAESLLRQLQSRQKAIEAEAKAALDIDRVLWRKWKEEGVHQGDPWKAPTHHVCAYPKGWVTFHGDQEWGALVHGALSEPGVDHEWGVVSSDDSEDPEGGVEGHVRSYGEAPPGGVERE